MSFVVPVRLPDIPEKLLHMVVVRGFGKAPMMLLTTLAETTTREALWQVVQGYMTRGRVIADGARSILSRRPRLLQPDFHLPRSRNRDFALCLQGFGDFSP